MARPSTPLVPPSFRSLLAAPGFLLVAVTTLALGIGATTAIFSVVDGVLLRPLPYPEAGRLVRIFLATDGEEHGNHSEPDIQDMAREAASLESVAAYRVSSPVLGGLAEPRRVEVVRASAPLLPLLGVEPALGRLYGPDDDRPGAQPVVVLSHGLWERVFGGDPSAVGRSLLLDDEAHSVVGVMPEGFGYPDPEAAAWAPLRLDPAAPWARNNHYLEVVARLADGVSLAAASAELSALGGRVAAAHPDVYGGSLSFRPRPLREAVVGDVRTPLLLLMGAVAGVLLIASVNAASLFLARGEARRGEIALRTALGAGRGRVFRQLLGEGLAVAALAAAGGVALAWGGVQALRSLAPADLPRLEAVGVDGGVLLFAVVVSACSGLLSALVPGVQAWRGDVREVLAAGGRGRTGNRRAASFRRGLVVTQLALASVLALGAGLLVRSFAELRSVDLGIRPAGVLTLPVSPPASAVPDDAAAAELYRTVEVRVGELPGVEAAGAALRLPLADGQDGYSVQLEGRIAASVADAPVAGMQWATPGYFGAMGLTVETGRAFAASDDRDAPLVAVVNRSLAGRLWPGEEPLGRRIRMFPEGSPWMEVVGVVSDVKHFGPREEAPGTLYVPHAQGHRSAYYSPRGMTLFVRAAGEPSALAGPVRAVLDELVPAAPVGPVRPMTEVVGRALAGERFTLLLLGAFSGMALLLAAVGVYGVVAHGVVARTREIGVRVAVGAGRRDVARQVVGEALRMAAWGVGAGLLGGLALSRLLEAVLYGVRPADPWAVATVVPVLVGTVLAASALPALRAARLDPVRALAEG